MNNAFLKPVVTDGVPARVRDPHSMQPLAAEGEWKPLSTFWLRRLRDKEVEEAEPEFEGAQAIADGAEHEAAIGKYTDPPAAPTDRRKRGN